MIGSFRSMLGSKTHHRHGLSSGSCKVWVWADPTCGFQDFDRQRSSWSCILRLGVVDGAVLVQTPNCAVRVLVKHRVANTYHRPGAQRLRRLGLRAHVVLNLVHGSSHLLNLETHLRPSKLTPGALINKHTNNTSCVFTRPAYPNHGGNHIQPGINHS